MGQGPRLLIFSIEGDDYAISTERLVEITVSGLVLNDETLTANFEGKMEFRDRILPVLNLKKVFKVQGKPGKVLLVLKTAKGEVGLLVDAVTEFLNTEKQVRPIPQGVMNPTLPYFTGILKHKGSILLLLNEDGLL